MADSVTRLRCHLGLWVEWAQESMYKMGVEMLLLELANFGGAV